MSRSRSIQLRFKEEDWDRVAGAWRAWWAGELDRPLVMIEDAEPPPGITISNIHDLGCPVPYFPLKTLADEVLDYYQVRLEAKRFYGDAWPKWNPNFGPGIVAAFLGAQVHPTADTVWLEPHSQVSIGDLHLDFDGTNVWWQRVLELTRCAVQRWDGRVSVAYTDLGGNLDILGALLTPQRLLVELVDHPDDVARRAGELTQLWLRCYNELCSIILPAGRGTTPWATLWSPGRCYMLQSDVSAMISPRMFERFVLPDLAACCQATDHAFYHLDGPGAVRHLDMLLSLERLRGIQWIPGAGAPPPEGWLPLLKRIRDAGKLCQLYVSPEGAQSIVRELGGQGFAFYITKRMSAPEARSLLHSLTAGVTQE